MTNFFRGIPDDLVESAVVDGATYWQVFTLIMARLALPALMTVGVLCFLGTWNDLLVGLLFLPDPETRTISVGVAALQGVRETNIEMILTGSLLSAIPPIVAFLLFEKYLVAGITAGIGK
jgi:multiple sugar transport system permease protein/raffinose/stachyose/melibiose transport system permease protein